MGYYSFNDEREDIEGILENALSSSQYGLQCNFDFPKPAVYKVPQIYDEKVEKLSIENMGDICRDFVDYVREKDENIVCDVSCETDTSITEIVNHNGLASGYKKTGYYFAVWIRKKAGDRVLSIYDTGRYIQLKEMYFLADQLLEEISWGVREVYLENRKPFYPILLSPSVLNYFLGTLLAMVCAQTIENEESILKDKIGQQVLSKNISIYDDGVSDWLMKSSPFDDEGVATGVTPIIEKGVFKNFIADLNYSSRMNTKPTGNGRKVNGRTMTYNNNIVIKSDDSIQYREIMANMQEGIFVGTALVNCNIRGDFIIMPKNSYLIQNGEIVGMLKNAFRINGNIFQLLNNILAISEERKITKYDMLLPYVFTTGSKIIW